MQYASVNGERQEAQPGLSGKCPVCSSSVTARCGDIRVKHWAHIGNRNCDSWWENETEWHREWKRCFPKEWQEVVHHSENGEKHIADVKTAEGRVIEFQRSPIKSEECHAREAFYGKMIWIVDGTRRSSDKDKFFQELNFTVRVDGREDLGILRDDFGKCALLRDWGGKSIPVFFDFGDDILWGLNPTIFGQKGYVFRVQRKVLVTSLYSSGELKNGFDELLQKYVSKAEARRLREIKREAQRQLQQSPQPSCRSHSIRRHNRL